VTRPPVGADRVRIATEAASTPANQPLLAVIVPTRNEAGNVAPLVQRIERVVDTARSEIVFVDDSVDGTPAEVARVARAAGLPIRLIHRPERERLGGLGGAVTAGLRAVDAKWACVMDGDLQHPPELIPVLIAEGELRRADVVIASRYCVSRHTKGLDRWRIAVSRGLTILARTSFPRRLRDVSDPLSGFFLIRRCAIDPGALRPRGFKVLLEILVRSSQLRTSDVPFEFGDRESGESKATFREGLTFISRLVSLRLSDVPVGSAAAKRRAVAAR
jgi:dolichol-phosphate mannosyltransferase